MSEVETIVAIRGAAAPEALDGELGEDELDHVAGGLARVWLEDEGASAAAAAAE